MTNYDRIHLKCKRGHEIQVACVGVSAGSPDDGYTPVSSGEDAAHCSEVVWGVYVRDPDDGIFLHIEDHPTRESALAAAHGQVEAFNLIAKHYWPGEVMIDFAQRGICVRALDDARELFEKGDMQGARKSLNDLHRAFEKINKLHQDDFIYIEQSNLLMAKIMKGGRE